VENPANHLRILSTFYVLDKLRRFNLACILIHHVTGANEGPRVCVLRSKKEKTLQRLSCKAPSAGVIYHTVGSIDRCSYGLLAGYLALGRGSSF